jgi:UMF1 family MFS transporter
LQKVDRSAPLPDNLSNSVNKRAVWGWALYDWANSAFATTIMAGFFPGFFKQVWSQGVDVNLSTFRLGVGNAVASLVVALMAPVLGAIADHGGHRKHFLIGLTYLGVLMTAALMLIPQGQWVWAMLIYACGVVGFSGGNVFYDSLLPLVAPRDRIDQVSSLGYSLGYLGGGLLFVLNVLMTLKPHLFGLADQAQAVRLSFASVAVWWGGFALITFFWLPSDPVVKKTPYITQIMGGLHQLAATFGKIRHLKTIFVFLLAYWCYIDGVHTIIRMAVDFGISLGFDFKDLIVALLITQFVGFPSALLFGFLSKKWGIRRGIYLALIVYMTVTLWGATMTRSYEFYLLAATIGLVQGGIQALSRAYYARLIPLDKSAEFYGFYNMLGKFAAIIGPVLMGFSGLMTKRLLMPQFPTPEQIHNIGLLATRTSIVSVLVLFILGGIIFYFVDEDKGRADLARLTSSK